MLVAATIVLVALLVFSEYAPKKTMRAIVKPLASIGFIAVGVEGGGLETSHGQLIVAGLVLSFFGDVFLLSKAKHWFLAGLVAFLLGHVAYGVGFTVRGVNHKHVGVLVGLMFGVATVVWRWLGPHVEGKMRGPVLAYIAVISWMLAAAIETSYQTSSWLVAAGALLFYLSDLFVARHRFVKETFGNKLLGLPLYYAGQLLLALYATV